MGERDAIIKCENRSKKKRLLDVEKLFFISRNKPSVKTSEEISKRNKKIEKHGREKKKTKITSQQRRTVKRISRRHSLERGEQSQPYPSVSA